MRQSPADPKQPWRVLLATDGVRDPAIENNDGNAIVEYVFTRDP